jgi:hypothetical protein
LRFLLKGRPPHQQANEMERKESHGPNRTDGNDNLKKHAGLLFFRFSSPGLAFSATMNREVVISS